jgi:hypothetical protein
MADPGRLIVLFWPGLSCLSLALMRWGTFCVSNADRWMPALSRQRTGTRLAITLLPVALYVATFVVAYPQFGLALGAVAAVPVSIVAYVWGTRQGLAAGIAFSPIHIFLLSVVFGEPMGVALQGGTGPGSLMLIGVGFIVGRMADMSRQIRAQQSRLVAEREALQEWRSRYSELVKTLTAGSDLQVPRSEALLARRSRHLTSSSSGASYGCS